MDGARIFQVDAFTRRRFGGNPAAVCLFEAWPEDAVLQDVASENNLSETAFLVPEGEGYRLRWFTPVTEVELCGHATLASGFVVLRYLEGTREAVTFFTRSGDLRVRREGERLVMDFPAVPAEPADPPPLLLEGLGARPSETLAATDWLAVFETEEEVAGLAPDMGRLARLDRRGVIVTAPVVSSSTGGIGRSGVSPPGAEASPPGAGDGRRPHFVSRFFAPGVGVAEDPVTGSAHCTLAPYWGARLGLSRLRGRQISRRGGEVFCELRGERVLLSGSAVLYLEGRIRC